MTKPMTEKQAHLLDFIVSFLLEHGYQPSARDMCRAFGWNSTQTVCGQLQAIERRGFIEMSDGDSRAVRILRTSDGKPFKLALAENVCPYGQACEVLVKDEPPD